MVQTSSSQSDGDVSAAFSVKIPIAALPRIHSAITESGAICTPDQIRARCLSCDFALTGTDLQELATADSVSEKLERVRLQYCARRGCDGRFYQVTLSPSSPEAQAALESLAFVLSPTATKARSLCPGALLKLTACAVAGGYVLFVLHHLYYGERVPLFQQEHHFEAKAPPR